MNLRDRFLYFYLPKYHRLFLAGKPIMLVNSMQKSGTHLLTDALAAAVLLKYNHRGVYNHALSRTWPKEKREKNTSASTVINFLATNAWPGELIRGHVEYHEDVATFLKKKEIPHVLVLRNPLDVLLSLANWWEYHQEINVVPFHIFRSLPQGEARFQFLLTGIHEEQRVWPDYISRYKAFLDWQDDKHTLLLTFESLKQKQVACAERIADYLPLTFNKKAFINRLNDRKSRTYLTANEKRYAVIPETALQTFYNMGGEEIITAFNRINS